MKKNDRAIEWLDDQALIASEDGKNAVSEADPDRTYLFTVEPDHRCKPGRCPCE